MAKKPLITLSEKKVGQVLDLVRHAIRKSGKNDEELQYLIERGGEFQDGIMPIIHRFATPPPLFQRDMREEGWKLIEDTPRTISSAAKLEQVSFLKKGEDYIDGEELILRARGGLRANYGQHDAEWLFEHQEEIPEKLREFYLLFTDTIWQACDGRRSVACLRWGGGRWDLRFRWLDASFFLSHDRLVRVRA